MAEFENATIQKQRQELHLLVAELRDRDRELNEMVSSHHKQLLSWDQDRQKILSLERMCSRLEREYLFRSACFISWHPLHVFRVHYLPVFTMFLICLSLHLLSKHVMLQWAFVHIFPVYWCFLCLWLYKLCVSVHKLFLFLCNYCIVVTITLLTLYIFNH